ncbi:MAG TPA: hypothetical protein VNA25_24390, partial [Phycisphaerae bacterium]|nr:hypothetical protein [Phycisphaerae bacterium]
WTDVDCYETCQNCGHRHDAVWAADDETWLAVMGSPAGFLCPGCFHRLAADKGIHIKWCANGPDCEDCHEENARLQAIIDKLLQKTDDGVYYAGYDPREDNPPLWVVWRHDESEPWAVSKAHVPQEPEETHLDFNIIIDDAEDEAPIHGIYSTQVAAEAAKEKADGN